MKVEASPQGKSQNNMESEKETGYILIAADGSPTSESAARAAIEIAVAEKRPVHGLYVVDETLVFNSYTDYQEELAGQVEPKSQAELVSWFEERGNLVLQSLENTAQAAGVPVTTSILFGGFPDILLDQAEKAFLVAVGRRGVRHPKEIDRLGSHFQTIAYHSPVPTLAGGGQVRRLERLLVAYDGSENSEKALLWGKRLRSELQAVLAIVAVNEEQKPASAWLAEIQEHLNQIELSDFQILTGWGDPVPRILEAIIETKADLLLMGRYRHTALLKWLVGSKVDQILRKSQLPVLVV